MWYSLQCAMNENDQQSYNMNDTDFDIAKHMELVSLQK